jgi:hypothetical protein
MAVRRLPVDDVPVPAFPGLSDAQVGSIAEERLATASLIQAPGVASLAFPLVDLGFDFYLRRIRTLRVHPVQVKARSFLDADRLFEASVSSLYPDPDGFVVLPLVPPPGWQLASPLWVIPIPEFLRLAKPHEGGFLFSAHLDPQAGEPATRFLVDVDKLQTHWFSRIPAWKDPVPEPPVAFPHLPDKVSRRAARPFGKAGELWLASQLIRAGLDQLSIAQDRLRLDCVDMLLHDLVSFAVIGLGVHSSTITPRGTVEFRNRYHTFFVNERLFVVLLVYDRQGSQQDICFVFPSADIPKLKRLSVDHGDPGYGFNFRFDPLAPPMRPYAVATTDLAGAILERLRATG